MRVRILLFMILVGIISINKINAQQCGTPTVGSNQEFFSSKNRITNDDAICINVSFHIVRQNNGTGGFNSSKIDLIVEDLNEYYNPFDIYINKQEIDFIDNTTYYDLTDNEFNGLIGINNNSNSINFYLVNSAPYAGRAQAILSKNLVVNNSYALSPTSAHELGHCLNLWHTHHGLGCNDLGGCAEAIDGSNSDTCGDFVTDTPADPCVLGQVSGNCQYTGGGGYNPDPTNIMSYGGSCRNHFTSGQAQRMRNTILGSSLLQQVITCCFDPEISGYKTICSSSETTYILSNNCDSVIWNVPSNLTILSQNQNSATVKPASTSTNGAAFIEAILPTQTIRKDIWVGKARITSARLANGQYLAHGSTTTNKVCKYEPIKTNINFGGTSYASWSMISSSHTTSWSQQGDNISFYLWAVNHTATFRITLHNGCGTFTRDYTFNVKDCSGGGNDPCDPIMSISQNPVDTEIEIINIPAPCDPVLPKFDNNNELLKNSTATLYDISGNPVKSKIPFDGKMNVETVKAGLYILVVTTDGVKESFRIIIN